MNQLEFLMDEAKEKAGLPSDYKLAEAIGITRQTISGYRHGRSYPDEYAKAKLAELTKRTFREVTARLEIEREVNPVKLKYWNDVLEAEKKKGPDHDGLTLSDDWRARRDSNARPLPSEGSTLSS